MASQSLITHVESGSGDLTIKDLPALLKKWLKLNEEERTLMAEVKQRKTEGKAIKETILRIMESNKVANINVSKGVVMHRTREVKSSLSRSYMFNTFKDFFNGDERQAEALLQMLESNREKILKHDLSLSGNDDGSSQT